jgi:hypothetical protein
MKLIEASVDCDLKLHSGTDGNSRREKLTANFFTRDEVLIETALTFAIELHQVSNSILSENRRES